VTDLATLLDSTLPKLGYELVDWDYQPRSRLMRVFIDRPEGVGVEDCARVSNHLSRLFAVENVDYSRLEVSSPGLDRPLRRLEDFSRFAGQEAQIRLRDPLDNARKLKAVLLGVEGSDVRVETHGGVRNIPFDNIEKARLVPRVQWR
jgi:ribosome maturation factor RimP